MYDCIAIGISFGGASVVAVLHNRLGGLEKATVMLDLLFISLFNLFFDVV